MSHKFKSETKDQQRPKIETHVTVIDVHCRACWMFQLAHQTSSRSLQMLESPLWQTMYNSICPLHKSIIAIENLLNSWLRKGPKSQQNRRHQEMLCFQNFNLRVLWKIVFFARFSLWKCDSSVKSYFISCKYSLQAAGDPQHVQGDPGERKKVPHQLRKERRATVCQDLNQYRFAY